MVYRSQRKMAIMSRKLDVIGCLISSQPLRRTSNITTDALLHQFIKELTSEVETLNREYHNLMKQLIKVPTEVKVERIEERILVRVSCEKGRDNALVPVLEAFEEMGLNVLEARVSSNHSFWMEAIGEAEGDKLDLDVGAVKQAILKALEKKAKEVLPIPTSEKNEFL